MRLTILHTNDIHGREERIAQISTMVHREKAASDHTVLYLDAGDVEETTNRLSSLTKGTAMHRLLAVAGCDATTVGNATWLRYGPAALTAQARATPYPHLCANFTGIDGVVPSVLIGDVGIFGLTAPFERMKDDVDWGFGRRDALDAARHHASDLRSRGAELVILLSHLGYADDFDPWNDRAIAAELQGAVDLIVGAHTHDLLPEGERVGSILIAQAGHYGEHIGRVEIDGSEMTASVAEVDAEPDDAVTDEISRIEREVKEMLDVVIGRLDAPFDARYVAEVMRRRAGADIGLYSDGQILEVLPPGPVTRRALWEASDSAANPGATTMTGEQLLDLMARSPELADGVPRPLRGRKRGNLVLVGQQPVPGRVYRVGSTDWELGSYGGWVPEEWALEVDYEFPLIVREAVEEHLRGG